MASWDQGAVLPLAVDTAITAAYNANTTSSALYGGRAGQVDVFMVCTTVGGSPITTVTINVQAQDRAGNWFDVESRRQDTDARGIEHVFVLGAAPQAAKKLMITCVDHGGAYAVRVRAHADAIGVAGDIISSTVTFS